MFKEMLCKGEMLMSSLDEIPKITIQNIDKESYIKDLASAEKRIASYKNIVRHGISNTISNRFNVDGDCFQIFDKRAGGVLFKDWEWAQISNSNVLKNLFETRENGKLNYCLETDEGRILRGADTYYYFLTNKGKSQKLNSDIVYNWALNNENFLTLALDGLNYISGDNVYERRLVLGVLDNIRNLSLIMLNMNIISFANKQNSVISLSFPKQNSGLDIWSRLCKECVNIINQICFSNKTEKELLPDIQTVLKGFLDNYMKNVKGALQNSTSIDLDKSFRSYREIDNYIENYIAMHYSIQNIKKNNPSILNKQFNFIGATYGGLELPFIANSILSDEILMSAILLQSKYSGRTPENYLNQKINTTKDIPRGDFNVLSDDNVLTGKTLQSMINLLFSNDIAINNISVVRYPSINRVDQMIAENSAVDVSKFFNYIQGLVFSSPYTKIKSNTNEKYLDELGIFNKDRRRLLEYLYKNGKFKENSEVADIQKMYERS